MNEVFNPSYSIQKDNNTPRAIILILNYQSYEDTITYIQQLREQKEVNLHYLVVDNLSPNKSYKYLKEALSEQKDVSIIQSPRNGGFSFGNNFGLKHLMGNEFSDNVIVSNNDLVIENHYLIKELINLRESLESPGFVSPVMLVNGEPSQNCGFQLPSLKQDIMTSVRFLEKLSPPKLRYNIDSKEPITVDCLPGSFFLTSLSVFEEIGFFDEAIFLYGEERVLGSKINKAGLKNYLIPTLFYNHLVSKTISVYYDNSARQRLIEKSRIHYHRHYADTSFLGLVFLKGLFFLRKLEDFLLSKIKG